VLAGVAPDYDAATALGYPALNSSELPLCGVDTAKPQCSKAEFFKEFGTKHPVYAPSTAPIYSNAAFQILGYAFEGITGRTVADAFQEDIIEPLGMSHTHYNVTPDDALGVIPFNATASWWNAPLGDESPAGSFYSSVSDLALLGRAILGLTQLSKRLTRRWMKPQSFTASPVFSVGAPWEIFRVQHDSNMVDIYTKLGGLGAYASVLILIPQYDLGITVLAAGAASTTTVLQVSNLITDDLFPVLEDVSRQEADSSFAGTYTSEDGLNSTIVIETASATPGLLVTTFMSNGTDMLATNVNTTLYPTGLSDASGRTVSYRASGPCY
jgi:CubicO group peptidase (beta-lactamase class C family)